MKWIKTCQDDWDYQLSDENIIEEIEVNDYDFRKSGGTWVIDYPE